MRILYVVSRPLEINTSASIRNKATIEGLLANGHSVDLITTEYDKNHLNFDNSLAHKNLNITYIKLKGIQSLAKMGRKSKLLQPIRRFAYKLLTKTEIYDNLKGIVRHIDEMSQLEYDLVISSSDPKSSHLFVKLLKIKNKLPNVPWIQIWGDPFLRDITRKSKFISYKIKREERRLLSQADKVIYVSNLTLKEQKGLYPEFKDKMMYVPIPYINEVIYSNKVISAQSQLTFLYSGDYSSNVRNIMPLYEAIQNTNHKLVICGDSNIKLKSSNNIEVYARQDYKKIKELEENSDILVHLSNKKGNQIPGKIYQYSGTNKPILFILDGNSKDLKDTFEPYNRYIFVDNSKLSIMEIIKGILQNKFVNKNFIVEEFHPKLLARNIIERN